MHRLVIALLFILSLTTGMAAADEARLLRFPDVTTDKIAFSYAGDIYIAPRTGGQATRLTSHIGLELFAKFSPDGKTIAFTGQYDGDQAVYIMPVAGGQPKKLSFHPAMQNLAERMGPENIVMGWHPDGKRVYFRSRKEGTDVWFGRVYLVDTAGGMPEPLPMDQAGFTSFSPDAQKVAFCPIFRDFRTWKRYKGGMAQDVWIFDLKTYENKKITDWIGTDNIPMWYKDKIYFNSDRTGSLNLFCYDVTTGQTRQVTDFSDYDVRWPSLGPDAIAFEKGGYIYVMDLPSETIHKVTIDVISDYHKVRPEYVSVSDMIYDFDISPDGKRALYSARGDIFTVPAKDGNTRDLTNSSGAHDKAPVWSPDGRWIAYISDETGEDEIYLRSQDGSDKVALTADHVGWISSVSWSPDSKKIAYSDKDNVLAYITVDSKGVTKVDQSMYSRFYDYVWSPDSRFLAYSKNGENDIRAVYVYALDDGSIHQMTPGHTNDYSPAFDPDGKYLYFLSERSFNPILDSYQFEFVDNAITNLYLILLKADEKSPFAPKEDEVTIKSDKDKQEAEKKDKEKPGGKAEEGPKEVTVAIDYDGIYDRQIAIDLPAGNYGGLTAISGAVFYVSSPMRGLEGRVGQGEPDLHKYKIEDKEDKVFAPGVGSYAISAGRDKMMLQKHNDYFIVNAQGDMASLDKGRVDVSHMQMYLDRLAEYKQIFNEAWRRNRDFFYDPNMHGVDWKAMHDKYAVLLPYVNHRFDLTYVIGEMVSELCCSHTYVGGGDMPRIPSSKVGLFGAEFEIDKKNNRIRISRILDGENWDESLRSPFQAPDVNIHVGDYLLAIDGQEITGSTNPYALTVNKADQLITVTVNDKPTMKGAHDETIKPIDSETRLQYYDWVQKNLAYVDSASSGQIGYIHIPDMGGFGLVRFAKMFYYQSRKPGLIIDVRANGGGFVSQLILKRLREPINAVSVSRNFAPQPHPGDAITAHMLTLINQYSVSDGDIFPYYFRWYKLGPLMGKRSWGGVVGIGGGRPLVDGGYNFIPGGTEYNLNSQWIIENHGVDPDIEVDNPLDREARGYDDQLIDAVKYIQKKLQEEPVALPPYPGPPAKR